jgi:ATP-dependent 26S proteasome regulatory subunit
VYGRVLNFVHLNTLLQVLSVVGILQDEVDPMVSVMKVEKAPMIC